VTKHVGATHDLLLKHLAAVRQVAGLQLCTIVLVLESNLAFESQHIIHAVTKAGLQKWVALSEGAGGSLGWLATNETKEKQCLALREALTVGSIRLSPDFFSVSMTKAEAKLALKDVRARPPARPRARPPLTLPRPRRSSAASA
jgi:hypothetical protein